MPATFVNGPLPAASFETLTVSSVALGITAAKLVVTTARNPTEGVSFMEVQRLDEAMFTVETNPCRFRLDGTDPTAAIGHLLQPGDSVIIAGFSNLSRLRFIRSGAADATVQATYYRKG